MKSKALSLIFLSFVLFSCGSGENNISSNGALKTTIGDNYEIGLPENWVVLENNDKNIPKPKNSTVVLAAHSNELNYGFSNSVLVLNQDLNKEITSRDFSILNNVGASKEYDEYLKLDSKNITFSDYDESVLYTFEAKYNTSTAKLKFLQVGKVCNGKKGNLITIALPTTIKTTSLYEDIIKSFKCK